LARTSITRAQRRPRTPHRPAEAGDDTAGMKMRQSLAELEDEFAREASLERYRRQWLQRTAARRKLKRETDRRHRRGSVRFAVLVVTLIATALVVTVAMFATLYLLLD
jgi:hypothetical protein